MAILVFHVTQGGKPVQIKGFGWAMDSFCQEYKTVELELVGVLTKYVLIPGSNSYMQKFTLGSEYSNLKPGRYLLSVDYSAHFPQQPPGCSEWSPESIKNFPFPAWTGNAQTNRITFEILPDVRKSQRP